MGLIRRCVMIGIALTLILVGMAISHAIGGQPGDILRGYSSTKPLKSQSSAAPTASLNESVGLHRCKLHPVAVITATPLGTAHQSSIRQLSRLLAPPLVCE